MEARIELVVGACGQCQSPTDRLIVAALAQNGPGFDAASVKGLPMKNGMIDWGKIMIKQGGNPSARDAQLRQSIAGMNFDTQFMLKLYMQDLRVLMQHGYQLPDDYADADLDYIDKLINNNSRLTPQ